jgi:dihydropteroate synthase
MGVVNLSHDSVYRESIAPTIEGAVRRGRRLAAEGARIVDVGAESSGHRAVRVAPADQRGRLRPVVRALASEGLLVAVETYDLETARACLADGASVLNLTSSEHTEEFYRLAAEYEAGVIVCFIEGRNARSVDERATAPLDPSAPYEFFAREIERATACGVRALWLDSGIGFRHPSLRDSTTAIRYQMETVLGAFRLRTLGWPVCQQLGDAFECFEEERRCGEAFFAVLAHLGQTDLLRTHEVAKVRGVLAAARIGQ